MSIGPCPSTVADPESTPSATKDVDLERELNKIVKQTATTFAPRASVAKPNPAFKGESSSRQIFAAMVRSHAGIQSIIFEICLHLFSQEACCMIFLSGRPGCPWPLGQRFPSTFCIRPTNPAFHDYLGKQAWAYRFIIVTHASHGISHGMVGE